MLALLPALLLGMLAGIGTGLLPGLHPNTVIFMLLPLYLRLDTGALPFAVFAAGVSVVHTFVGFVPSVFLGVPGADTALAALPGHRMVQAGRGLEAVERSIYGGLIAALAAAASVPLLLAAVPRIYAVLRPRMHLVLGGVLVLMVAREPRPVKAAAVAGLSAGLGLLALDTANPQYVFLPLFGGLFGLSTLVMAVVATGTVPRQARNLQVDARGTVPGGIAGLLAGVVAGFLPGVGAAQSALLVRRVVPLDRARFLVAMGGITTADLLLSLLALHLIGNPRSGAAVAVQQVMQPDAWIVATVFGAALVAAGVGATATRLIAPRAARLLVAVAERRVLLGVGIFLAAVSLLLVGPRGLVVLLTGTAIGTLAQAWRVRRSVCMAVLIVPTILFYL